MTSSGVRSDLLTDLDLALSSVGWGTVGWGTVSVSVIVGGTGGISVLVSVLVWSVGITSVSVGGGSVSWGSVSVSVSLSSVTVIYKVDSTEVGVSVALSVRVASVGGVSGSWGTWLNVRVSVGAHHERAGVSEVDSVISALAGVSAVVLVLTAGSGSSDEGEDDEGLHVAVVS